jgi:hypothetical protein
MKNKQRKLIVLGAGASIGSKRFPIKSLHDQWIDKMPSAENFFFDLFKTNEIYNKPAGHTNFLGLMDEELNDLITTAWNINHNGYNPEEWKNVNIEELMTFLDTGSKMYPQNSTYQKVFKQSQKALTAWISRMLSMRADGQYCYYLREIFVHMSKGDSIISYNWDTIADHTLFRIKAEQLKNYARLLRDDKIIVDNYINKGILLKLHGSLNWMICHNSNCKDYKKIRPPFQEKRYQLLNIIDLWTCKSCGEERTEPLILPPVSNKMIHKNSFLKKQWLIARQKLVDVTELIFIGYSFPPTDYYSDWLFRQLNLIEGKDKPRIIIVNPEYSDKSSLVYKRYSTIFNDFEITHFNTLKDYVT